MSAVWPYLPSLLRGARLTIYLVLLSGSIGTVLGLIFGAATSGPSVIVRWIGTIYPNFMRGIPPLVILFFVYFALPLAFPSLLLPGFLVAAVGLSVYAGAYFAEIFRGSIEAVDPGQSKAAIALGLGYVSRMVHVVLPQALKIAIPPGINFVVALVKASSFVSLIGSVDLTFAGKIASSQNLAPVETFVVVAIMYFIISYPIALLGKWLERKIRV